jgi:hypothetical protein
VSRRPERARQLQPTQRLCVPRLAAGLHEGCVITVALALSAEVAKPPNSSDAEHAQYHSCKHERLRERASPGWGGDEPPLGPAEDGVRTETDAVGIEVQVRRGRWIARQMRVASVKQAVRRHNDY